MQLRTTYRSAAIAAAIATALTQCAEPSTTAAKSEDGAMVRLTLRRDYGGDQPLDLPLVPMEPVEGEPTPAVALAPTADANATQAFGSAQRNSRLPRGVPSKTLSLRWRAPINADFRPFAVLASGDRILVHGQGVWRLFDRAGTRVRDGRYGSAVIAMDGANDAAYVGDQNNALDALSLRDGKSVFYIPPSYGDMFRRPAIWRHRNRLFVLGVEGSSGPHSPKAPDTSVMEYVELEDELEVDEFGGLLSISAAKQIAFSTTIIAAAPSGERVVVAVPGILCVMSQDLEVASAYTADFIPRHLSVDELARAYIVTDDALWVVTADGRRVVDVPLPSAFRTLVAPPIVGYDHRVYLLTESGVLGLGADGAELWRKQIEHAVVGGGITPNGHLLVGTAHGLISIDPSGDVSKLLDQPMRTPPIVTHDGLLLFATADELLAYGADD